MKPRWREARADRTKIKNHWRLMVELLRVPWLTMPRHYALWRTWGSEGWRAPHASVPRFLPVFSLQRWILKCNLRKHAVFYDNIFQSSPDGLKPFIVQPLINQPGFCPAHYCLSTSKSKYMHFRQCRRHIEISGDKQYSGVGRLP